MGASSLYSPNTTSVLAPRTRSPSGAIQSCTAPTRATTMATDAACPSAIGPKARSTAARLRSCRPSATAKSHPMPGFDAVEASEQGQYEPG